jgi:hypothetical protein
MNPLPLLVAAAGVAALAAVSSSRKERRTVNVNEPTIPPPPVTTGPLLGSDAEVAMGDGTEDVILSFMALSHGLKEFADSRGIRVVEVPPTGGGGHPSWNDSPSLTALIKKFGLKPRRIAAFGFSAGSNSGLRSILRRSDAAQLSFVCALDGMHPMLSPKAASATAIGTRYQDAANQFFPFANYALQAAHHQATMVISASQIPAPPPWQGWSFSTTADALLDVVRYTSENAPEAAAPATPEELLGVWPQPIAASGAGDFLALWYPRSGDDEQDHIDQANIVGPAVARSILGPLWDQEAGGLA